MTSKNQWRWHVKHLESFRNHICPQVWSLVLLITELGVGAVVGVGVGVGGREWGGRSRVWTEARGP